MLSEAGALGQRQGCSCQGDDLDERSADAAGQPRVRTELREKGHAYEIG
jgi:hypothetical protein